MDGGTHVAKAYDSEGKKLAKGWNRLLNLVPGCGVIALRRRYDRTLVS